MVPPTEVVPRRRYPSPDGNPVRYYFDIPFADNVKHITLDLLIEDLSDANARVSLDLVQSLTRDIADDEWHAIESTPMFNDKSSEGYSVATTTESFGGFVRAVLTIQDSATTNPMAAVVSARASGKPF